MGHRNKSDMRGDIIVNRASAFFEFRYRGTCFRAGLQSNTSRVRVIPEEEE
ncbi:hypothetical protein FHS18_003246 [Paenibacillus phyllosphaerae]|uniref:Uncharacterized protein n=1 Tax=Paenibacillus phyllosphaerae TaxID=274593 RepID=A0A7W5FNH1_9BACL|nr:hypothetical protein [Paenibacillus phyllosphaerae]MBB3111178.1 hypothetical protein [Paenibacillus phyllosphaerae]